MSTSMPSAFCLARRTQQRFAISGKLPHRIAFQAAEGPLDVIGNPVDVSMHGIAIVAGDPLDIDSVVTLKVNRCAIDLRVMNCVDLGGGRFRTGLRVVDSHDDLRLLFKKGGRPGSSATLDPKPSTADESTRSPRLYFGQDDT